MWNKKKPQDDMYWERIRSVLQGSPRFSEGAYVGEGLPKRSKINREIAADLEGMNDGPCTKRR